MLGQTLSDRYEINSELGRGGMGVVYAARDPRLNRDVAIKLIAPSMLTPDTELRFQSEAQVVAQMDHPSIVPIFDFGRHEGSLFFVMPIVEGVSLRALMREGTLNLGQVVDIAIDIAEALSYSHERGVVHRDVKPENVLVSSEPDGTMRVRVMDFGLARGGNVSSLTKTGMLVGTISYISPEQVSRGEVDGRSDLYSLGCVLYECVVNEVPFTGEMQSVLYRVVHEVPQSPRALGCKIDEPLERIIMSCLAKDPGDRPQKASELARDLRRYRASMRDSQKVQSVMMTATMIGPRPAQSPFVGRDAEFHELQKRLNNAVRGECQFVVVAGDAGVGKTRLLEELATLAAAREIRVLRGRFMEQHGAFPYIGFCEAIQEYFRQKEAGSSSSGLPELQDVAADLVSLFPMLSEVEAIRSAAGGGSQIAHPGQGRTAENRTQIFELLARTLTRLAGGKPLVLLFEDLHGAEASIEALQYIVLRLGPTPTLITASYRSTEVDRRHPLTEMLESFEGDRRFASVPLGPLRASEHRTFLSTLTGGTQLSDELAAKLFEATEGNPFFTKELVRSLMDSGGIAQDDTGVWSLSGGAAISSEALPATIQQAVEARIGRLPEDLRRVLSVASVMGKTFELDDLEALYDGDADLDDAMDRFIGEGLLEEDRQSRGDRFTFSSGVVREVLYGELSRRKRRSLHRQFAERLEKRHAGRLDRVYAQLLYHSYEGEDAEKAVEYGLLHARKSLDAFSPDEAMRAARTALEFLTEDWDGDRSQEGEGRMVLAAAHRLAGDMPAALRETAAAVEVFERAKDPERALDALLAAARAAWQVRQTEETRRWVERGLDMARKAGDGKRLAEFLRLAATLANLRADYARGGKYLEEAERLAGDEQASAPGEAIPRGGRLVVALANDLQAHHPVDMQLSEEFEVYSNVFEALVGTDDEGNLHPLLAASWEARDEGQTFRFTLRPGVRFHDGAPLSSQAVTEAFAAAMRRASGELPPGFAAITGAAALAAGEAEGVSGLQASGADAVEIHLVEPLPIYPALLSDRRTAVARIAAGDGGEALVGTGPFRRAKQTAGSIVLERNEDYWKGETARLDAIEFRTGLNAAAIARGFRSGELDVASDLAPQDLEDVLRDPRFADGLVEHPQKFTYFVLFNVRSGPATREPRVREALAGSLRTRDLVWRTLGRFAAPAVGLLPPGILGHDPGRRPRVLALDEAKKLVRAAGASGLRLRAAVHPLFRDRHPALLQGLLDSWTALDVEVELGTADMESYLAAWHDSSGFDMLICRWKPDIDDPDGCTHTLFHSDNGLFRGWYATPEADELLDKARREGRPAARELLYRKFESLLLDNSVLVPLFHDIGYRLCNPRVRGLRLRSIQPAVHYQEVGKLESAAAAASAPRQSGGVIGVPVSGRVRNLDPSQLETVEEAETLPNVFEPLLRDLGEARIEPWLAAEWRVEESGRLYRFRLRDDVSFHDGRRLSVRDVRFTLERLLQNEKSPNRTVFSGIKGADELLEGKTTILSGIRIHSASELSIELERPLSFFPVLLAGPFASIVPEGTEAIGGSMEEGAVGTGPFRVARFTPGERLELERNPSYWRRGFPLCERLVFDFGLSPETILEEFKAGRLAIAADLYPADAEALRRDPELGAGYREVPRLSTYMAVFNVKRGPLADRELRRRLIAAIDVPRIVKQTLGTLALPAQSFIPPGLLGHDPRAGRTASFVRPAAERGSGALVLKAALHPAFLEDGELSGFSHDMAKALGEIGVTLEPITRTMGEFLDAPYQGEIDVLVGRWLADYPDADNFAYLLHSAHGLWGQLCGIPEIDRLILDGRTETEPEARHAIYRRMEEVIAREALLMPLFHDQVYRFARPELEGLQLSYLGTPTVAFERLSIGPRR
ncbi:MAG TPA: ABC transporter substrate-binding protein [Thermoanaerobaculia bacterium]|nr:ABC transporter substrate-binding protein [Thermoanaerobaculia bacterium]